MSAWDQLLAATHPGREVQMPDGEHWLLLSRAYRKDDGAPWERLDRITLTVELVRSGSTADPRRLPPDAPPPTRTTDPEGA